MRSIKIGLGVVVVLMFSVAMTASSASATGFLATKLEELLSEKVATQVFKTINGNVECTEAKIEGGLSNDNGEQSLQLALIQYNKCTAFGFGALITLADYLFHANGKVTLDNLVHISLHGNACLTSVPAQELGTVNYDNNGRNILLLPNVKAIKYTANNSCLFSGEQKDGEYTGNSEVMVANGILSFMP